MTRRLVLGALALAVTFPTVASAVPGEPVKGVPIIIQRHAGSNPGSANRYYIAVHSLGELVLESKGTWKVDLDEAQVKSLYEEGPDRTKMSYAEFTTALRAAMSRHKRTIVGNQGSGYRLPFTCAYDQSALVCTTLSAETIPLTKKK